MQIAVRRHSSVPVPEQIRFQVELQILTGALQAGARLPSVRALARRLGLHANTVSAAYRSLEATGRVRSRAGSGVYVEPSTPAAHDASNRDVDAALHVALEALSARGPSRSEVRSAVERWLTQPAPRRVVVVDRTMAMAQVLAFEIATALKVPVSAQSLDGLAADATSLADSVVVTLPYHLGPVSRLLPGVTVAPVWLVVSEPCRRAVADLEPDSLVVAVSQAEAVFPFAQAVVHGLRGEELTLLTFVRSDRERWPAAARAAQVVLADALSLDEVRRVRPRGVQEMRLLDPASLAPLGARF